MLRAVGGIALGALALAAGAAYAQTGEALSLLTMEKNGLAWDGVGLGNSLVSAERRIGVTLALERNPESNPCAPFVAIADHHGLTLTLGFASPKPGAKIDWLRVRFEGQQVAASGEDLAKELRARFPAAEWRRPADAAADLTEADDLSPVFLVPGGKKPQAVRFAPREHMEFAEPGCFR